MLRAQDAFLDGESFQFRLDPSGIVQLSFGPAHVAMTLDSAYELQQRLAGFLAQQELPDYEETSADPINDERIQESKACVEFLAGFHRTRRFDA